MRLAVLVLILAARAIAQTGEPLKSPASAKPPELTARLYADQTAIVPGGRVGLVLELQVSKPWHMYDPVILDTGLATSIVVTEATPGLTLDPWQFPTPQHGEQFGLEYLEHAGTFRVLGGATLAADASSAQAVKLSLEVRGLACIEQCVPVSAKTSLDLPVSSEFAAANEAVFASARKSMPVELEKAEYIEGSRLLVSHEKLPVGGSGEILLQMRVRKEHHIQHRDPGVEDLIASRVFVETVDGLVVKDSEQVWPKPHVREMPGFGKVNELNGEFVVAAPFRIADSKFQPRTLRLRVLFRYQACTDKGQCYAPQFAVATASFEVVPEGQPAVVNQKYRELKPAPDGGQAARSGDATPQPAVSQAEAQNSARQDGGQQRSGGAVAATAAPASPLWYIFLLAFLGGMLLNIMPCVLPVISLKILSFVKQSGESHGRIFALGLMYAVGVLFSFAALAALLISTRSAWGGQMQSPTFVMILAVTIFAFALSLLGVFEFRLPASLQRAAAAGEHREGFTGAFLNGVLATAVATPCTAPLLGTAVGSLIALPPLMAGAGILCVGAGLAFPYVILTAFPAWLKALPRPGPWMETFKQVVGFITLIVVVWLLWIFSALASREAMAGVLLLLVFVGMAAWVIGRISLLDSPAVTVRKWATAAIVVVAGIGLQRLLSAMSIEQPSISRTGSLAASDWRAWEPGIGPKLAREGYTVYVDYTADWCLTCKVNKGTSLNVDSVRQKMAQLGVVRILADFTDYNPDMQAEINAYGRNGVPLNLVYPADKPDEPIVLPELLTPGIVLKAVEQAGPSRALARVDSASLAIARE